MPLFHLPNELLIQISEELDPKDLDCFIRTNRYLAILLTPIFHKIAAHVVLSKSGDTGLIWAIKNHHERLIGSLLDCGSNIESVGWEQQAPLTVAAAFGNVAAVRLLIDRGAAIAPQCSAQPLHSAAMKGQIETARILLEKGADIEATEASDGNTPLCRAVLHNRGAFSKFLLEKGADINARNVARETALEIAVTHADEEIFLELCDKGADITLSSTEMTVLHKALRSRSSERMIRALLEKGADVTAQTSDHCTVLHYAIDGDASEKVFQLLLDTGAEVCVNVRDTLNGETPLLRVSKDRRRDDREHRNREKSHKEHRVPDSPDKDLAETLRKLSIETEANQEAIVRALVNRGADIHATEINGETSLHGAAQNGYVGIAKILLDNGAELVARDEDEYMALHRAAEGSFKQRYKENSGHIAVMKLLLERGADIDSCWKEGTVRQWATPGNKSLRGLLEEMGMDAEELIGYESDEDFCDMYDTIDFLRGEADDFDYDWWSDGDDDGEGYDDDDDDGESCGDENSWNGDEFE